MTKRLLFKQKKFAGKINAKNIIFVILNSIGNYIARVFFEKIIDYFRVPVLCQCCKYEKPQTSEFPMARGPMLKHYILAAKRKLLQSHLSRQLDIRWRKFGDVSFLKF